MAREEDNKTAFRSDYGDAVLKEPYELLCTADDRYANVRAQGNQARPAATSASSADLRGDCWIESTTVLKLLRRYGSRLRNAT